MDTQTTPPTDEREGLPSASGAERLVACKSSWKLEQKHGIDNASSAAKEGTAIALAMETGETDGEVSVEVISERLSNLEQQALARFREQYGLASEEIEGPFREDRLWVTDANGKKHSSAKLDVYWIGRAKGLGLVALFLDHKTGYKDVHASTTNWQLRVQSIALYQKLMREAHQKKLVVGGMIGGIAHVRFAEKLDYCEYDADTVAITYDSWMAAVQSAQQAEHEYALGSWCRYCAASHMCPAMRGLAAASLVAEADVDMMLAKKAFLNRASINSALESIGVMFKGMKDEQLDALGLKRKKNGDRSYLTDGLSPWVYVQGLELMVQSEYWEMASVSRGALVKELAGRYAKKYKMKKADATTFIESALADCTRTVPVGASIVEKEPNEQEKPA